MSLGYGLLMVLASASVAYDPLSETRFWLLVQPLLALAFARALSALEWPRLAKQACAGAWAVLALHATFVFARELVHELPRVRDEQGFFAARFGNSRVVQRALELHDAGECQLATDDAVTLLPQSGTRPLKFVGDRQLARLAESVHAQPLCLVLIRDATMRWSMEGEPERVYQHVRRQRKQLAMDAALKDELAELWLPHALAPAHVAMP